MATIKTRLEKLEEKTMKSSIKVPSMFEVYGIGSDQKIKAIWKSGRVPTLVEVLGIDNGKR